MSVTAATPAAPASVVPASVRQASWPGLFGGPRLTAVLLVLAPLAEVVEAVLSPLPGTTTTNDLVAIAAHQQAYVVSVMFGVVATLLYLPGFLGLVQACRSRTPRWARATAWIIALSMTSYVGLRATQGTELALARSGLPAAQAARILDDGWHSPIGMLIFVLFLGGAFLGLIALCVTTWRAGFPRPAALLLALFQPVDLALDGQHGTAISHVVLLVGLGWIAVCLWRGTSRTPVR